jgi:hypothetical protein
VIIDSWPRFAAGTLFLLIAAATGVMAWTIETCTGGAADSLWTGAITLVLNIAAWMLLRSGAAPKLVLFVAALPMLAAVSYSLSTLQLTSGYVAHGRSACALITADDHFDPDGREPLFILLWLFVCASFWGGFVPAVVRAWRVYGASPEHE